MALRPRGCDAGRERILQNWVDSALRAKFCPRMESEDTFHYDEAQWGEIADIVKRAGGVAARERLDAQRVKLERWAGAMKRKTEDVPRRLRYRRSRSRAERKLKSALDELEWWFFADAEESWANFTSTLDHIHRVAEKRMTGPRYSEDTRRNLFFERLGLFWARDLGLDWAHGYSSAMVQFIAAACGGVYDFGHNKPLSTISGYLRTEDRENPGWLHKVLGVKITPADQ